MLCVTLTLANNLSAATAEQNVNQLVASLYLHPNAVGGEATGFKAIGQRQVQGCLWSPDETVGFILSAARSAMWGVHLGLLSAGYGDESSPEMNSGLGSLLKQAAHAGDRTLRAPGGAMVELARAGSFSGPKHAPEVGPIESTLQLLCALERRRSDEGQKAGLMINAGQSQTKAAELLGVSQQAVSSRLQAGYWYESRTAAYWLAQQIEKLTKT